MKKDYKTGTRRAAPQRRSRTAQAAWQLGKSCAVLVNADKMDWMAGMQAILSTPASSPERDAALDAYRAAKSGLDDPT